MKTRNLAISWATLVLIATALLAGSGRIKTATAEEPAYIPDPTLKAAIEEELGVSDPTPMQMLALDSLTLMNRDQYTIKKIDLQGLQYAANLSLLSLYHYEITDLVPLTGLPKLEYLHLGGCMIKDLFQLPRLTHLNFLSLPNLKGSGVLDLSIVSKLSDLETLDLESNWINDLTPLARLTDLKALYLGSNSISNLAPLAGLTRLEALYLERNWSISDLSALVPLTSLQTLNLGWNSIRDLSPLAGLTRLETLSLYSNQISDISALSNLAELRFLYVSHNSIHDLSPLMGLKHLRQLDLNFNPLDDEAFTVQIPAIVKNNPRVTLTLVLDIPMVWVQISSTRGGTVVRPGEGTLPFKQGTTITVEARSDSGCPFTGWTGTAISSGKVADPKAAVIQLTLDEDCSLTAHFLAPRILYVCADAPGENDGSSWKNAYHRLQDALASAGDGDEVRVARGTYKPDQGAGIKAEDPGASFYLRNGVTLKGGYAGSFGRDPNARNFTLYPTILSGDLRGNDKSDLTLDNIARHSTRSDNNYYVVAVRPGDANCVLDGFTVTQGHGGGGFLCASRSSPVIRNCTFRYNYGGSGGAINCDFGQPVIENCTFENNMGSNGGALFLYPGEITQKGTGTEARARLKDCAFRRNSAQNGGAIYNGRSRLELINCSFTENSATGYGGAIGGKPGWGTQDEFEMTDCNFACNSGESVIGAWLSKARISGTVQLVSDRWDTGQMTLTGDGTLRLDGGSTLAPSGPGIIECNISGDGAIDLPLDVTLTIRGEARVEVGRIDCGGLLRLCERAQIVNSRITTRRMSFEDDAIVSNSVIVAEAGAPYGQFFIEQTARVGGNEIHADGDRYMDLDPTVFAGLIENNRIYVTVTEGVGNKRGGLFELRGRLGMGGETICDPNNPFLCRIEQVPKFDPASWMIEELRLVDGAQLNLTNRFDFQPPYDQGGQDEVLYVRNLYLGKGSVLNTSFNKIYYENLFTDPCAVVKNVPLLGFSLNNIGFDDNDEFAIRISTNNVIHDEPSLKQYDRIHVRRVADRQPDPCGVMEMRNLRDIDPNSPTFGQTVYARAKGLFAKSSEPWIQIRFEYLFTNPAGGAALMIYLSDIPELPDRDDPIRRRHYLEVARLPQPPDGRPGSAGSGRWGVFDMVAPVKHLDFVRGTRIELELIGPEGTCVFINNFDPAIRCTYTCGDVAGAYHQVNAVDFLATLSECGRSIDAVAKSEGRSIGCLDGFFCADGYVTIHDAMAVDWVERKNLCPDELLAADLEPAAYAYHAATSLRREFATGLSLASAAPGADLQGQFLVSAKRYEHRQGDIDDFLSDRLYGLDTNGTVVSGPVAMTHDRFNGKLVRDHNGTSYQLNLGLGLVRISDNKSVVVPGSLTVSREPRYGMPATLYIGLQGTDGTCWGRPLLDTAFDAQGNVYVVPVVVALATATPYVATAKLKLGDPDQSSGYSIEQIFDDAPAPNDNHAPTQLREVEVDKAGNVYVLNCHYLNSSDILWVYRPDGQRAARRELQELGISAPVGLCVSRHDPSRLYLASSENRPDADSVRLYVLATEDLNLRQAIEIYNMGHITDIAEDPISGDVCVVGFQMTRIPPDSQFQGITLMSQPPFYEPRIAILHSDDPGPVEATYPIEAAVNRGMALPLSVIWAEGE